ncbi:ABC transporter permease [Aerobium aerolatum]|uniref:Polar amino acid transport system permease protein n=1 Tax=Aquamicrobium aerolatum DSM 21857 TaxID=1121003 RepID=A0A1I3KX75_9HYPH|nr:ABC transporter permease [Aquamicrobium aerolatum]SFI76938.1 polar amino acid transport system permease protein [Aquamicrobium aerolatum DSM 21857]
MSTASRLDVIKPPEPSRAWTKQRIVGYFLVSLWGLAALGLIIFLVRAWNPELFSRYAPSYFSGLIITIQLVGLSLLLGALLSLPIAYARDATSKWAAWPSYMYVYFFRGTPLLAQTFLIYYGVGSFKSPLEALGLWWFFRDAWYCALLAFTLNTAAYQAEILRGAVKSVPSGQWEGADSLGLPRLLTFRKIVLPQALIVALRPYGNEIILMIKGSAIVAIITVYDLMGETRRAYSRTFDFQTYLWAAIIYLAIVETLRNLIEWIERRITRHLKR